jgi:integrase
MVRDTGQRQGDLLRLQWSALEGNFLNVRQSKNGTKSYNPVI